MNITKEETKRLYDDKIESWYICWKSNEYRINAHYFGAYDEYGDETIGIGAELSINETKRHDEETIDKIKRAFWEVHFERHDDVIMNCASDIRTILSVNLENSPDETEKLLKEILGTLAMMDL